MSDGAVAVSAACTHRLVPIRCFVCGMFVNHFQERYDGLLATGHSSKDAFGALGIRRPCCRVLLFSTAVDLRLRRRQVEPPGFAKVTLETTSTAPYTLATTGLTDEVDASSLGLPRFADA